MYLLTKIIYINTIRLSLTQGLTSEDVFMMVFFVYIILIGWSWHLFLGFFLKNKGKGKSYFDSS